MINIPHLEMHLTHGCNLSCESCSHYSKQGHKGILSLAEAEHSIKRWNRRLIPHTFLLLGGEPTLHPDLPAFVLLARKAWPSAHLRLVTNGFFLHRHPALPAILQRDPNAGIYLSIHHEGPEYKEKLKPVLMLLKSWVRHYRIRVNIYLSFKHRTRGYRGSGNAMAPFKDGQPRQSWERCPAKHCPQLFEGKIWKCAPLAYLKLQDAKYRLADSWQPYLQYQPLESGCSDEQLVEFFQREEELFCGMCPANQERFELLVPFNSSNSRISRDDR